ncbi:hypothetical protein GCM10023188_31430 [Pontibacter saemangeumensis]|uniref:Transposase n=1 Tax=Pontibacter saemangeumensis TaxID=1084525 RepID=A0ABP8LWJ6_9BACT
MARIDYPALVREEVSELLRIEQQQRALIRDRVRFIRLLKEGKAQTQRQAGELVGLKRRKSQLLWKQCRDQGLDSLLQTHHKGSWAKLDSCQQARLLQRLDQDDISTQRQLPAWLQAEMGVTYSQPGLSCLLTRLKVKLKTGRPVNVRKDEAGEAAFERTSRAWPLPTALPLTSPTRCATAPAPTHNPASPGRRPRCPVRLGYEWAYLYVALCPFTGDVFAMRPPRLDKAGFQVFLEQLALHLQEKGTGPALLIGDGAAAHTAQVWGQHGLDWQRLPGAQPGGALL